MSHIRILADHIANQIAAGEVVERPASVIKELVENSLDANAAFVDIEVRQSGGFLRVTDDGDGMGSDDVLLCIERHATSKIRDEKQLSALSTLGFRGEALPSIASVSWMVILSRQQDQELGTRAEIRHGVLRSVHQDGCPRGTTVEVRHLFGNVPARRKFLKSVRTEMYHVEEVVRNLALAHQHVGFTLKIEGRTVLNLLPDTDVELRVREIFQYQGPLLPIPPQPADAESTMAVEGYLLLPETAPAGRAQLRLLVNGRPVQDGMLRHAVNEGLQGFLMKGYRPAGVLLLTIAPDQVDVNVHPAKREVRFRQANVVHGMVAGQVRRAMNDYQQQLRTSLFSRPGPSSDQEAVERSESINILLPSFSQLTTAEPGTAPCLAVSPPQARVEHQTSETAAQETVQISSEPTGSYGGLTLIGQLFSLYLLCEKDGRFIVIDQHAAHERLLYGKLLQEFLAARVPQQSLLFPVTIELTPVQAETLEEHVDEVAALGVAVEHFGGTTWLVKAVPALTSHIEPQGLLREILDALRGPMRQEDGRPVPPAIDELLASMACKAAIKAGNRLQPVEMLKLLAQMEEGTIFSHCPHGRPVLKTFTAQEVERWFHRHGG
ncbi:DNA mismatch repair endonuclease MutL [Desulfobulbus oligotrophicus]|uniref:DNA mismatch repair protein MutL n=1 Tax=Desulfobulbus oligotrophicus TaxID=1909699 RepID=A0A7T6AQJ6_9BACT|nr:DNA mismatch repair endonuclease MutL [Desulfobulbus oligotrophicus]MDY0390466.1 DNA mismatch repair endonuclease MutL [Desulfobulbus oligotrophicus]QQG65826.1 DNA mismatch repair endonuclease MutL [Desulfobulbus oligotrophicus]